MENNNNLTCRVLSSSTESSPLEVTLQDETDFISQLPDELLEIIFTILPGESAFKFNLTCRKFSAIQPENFWISQNEENNIAMKGSIGKVTYSYLNIKDCELFLAVKGLPSNVELSFTSDTTFKASLSMAEKEITIDSQMEWDDLETMASLFRHFLPSNCKFNLLTEDESTDFSFYLNKRILLNPRETRYYIIDSNLRDWMDFIDIPPPNVTNVTIQMGKNSNC